MDLTFPTDTGKINYRVAALMLRENRVLAMKDDRSPYFDLPGGRVHMGEAAEDAILRELSEELGGDRSFRIIRPVFLVQSFFTDDTDGVPYHELCLYFLIDFREADFPEGQFAGREGNRVHSFRWPASDRLGEEYFYPTFLQNELSRLPDTLTLCTERG